MKTQREFVDNFLANKVNWAGVEADLQVEKLYIGSPSLSAGSFDSADPPRPSLDDFFDHDVSMIENDWQASLDEVTIVCGRNAEFKARGSILSAHSPVLAQKLAETLFVRTLRFLHLFPLRKKNKARSLTPCQPPTRLSIPDAGYHGRDICPLATSAMLQFMSSSGYNAVHLAPDVPAVVLHARAYNIACRYEVAALKGHAAAKFRAALVAGLDVASLLSAADEVYNHSPSTPADDRTLRDAVVEVFCVLNKELRDSALAVRVMAHLPGLKNEMRMFNDRAYRREGRGAPPVSLEVVKCPVCGAATRGLYYILVSSEPVMYCSGGCHDKVPRETVVAALLTDDGSL